MGRQCAHARTHARTRTRAQTSYMNADRHFNPNTHAHTLARTHTHAHSHTRLQASYSNADRHFNGPFDLVEGKYSLCMSTAYPVPFCEGSGHHY